MFSSGMVTILLKMTLVGVYLFGGEREAMINGALTIEKVKGVFEAYYLLPFAVLVTTIIWLLVTFFTKPEDENTLFRFYKKVRPGGPGWSKVIRNAEQKNIKIVDREEGWSVPSGILVLLLACIFIYSCLFATGYWIYGNTSLAIALTIAAMASGYLLKNMWGSIRSKIL